ncbi:hypothetical protein AAIB08_30165 (plasmid) [Klebsiella pneumoniae]|nr:hypothetical protein [Klebsiella pneumoniae]MDY1815753.1 hypothetical protein [Klebsiella pneumoniae]
MFNTDSLAWQWHIPELARQIYPWVSWLYREYYSLAGFFSGYRPVFRSG